MKVFWSDPVYAKVTGGIVQPELSPYYQVFSGPEGAFDINYYRTDAFPYLRQRPVHLEGGTRGTDHFINKVVEVRELLRENFGSLYTELDAYVDLPLPSYANSCEVLLQDNKVEYEPVIVSNERPNPLAGNVMAVSMVRVFRQSTENYEVLIAEYSPSDGLIRKLYIQHSRGGNWIPETLISTETTGFRSFNNSGPQRQIIARYDLPIHFDLSSYLNGSFRPGDTDAELELLDVHYDWNRTVRQEIIRSGKTRQLRWLTYRSTPLDSTLDPIIRERFEEEKAQRTLSDRLVQMSFHSIRDLR